MHPTSSRNKEEYSSDVEEQATNLGDPEATDVHGDPESGALLLNVEVSDWLRSLAYQRMVDVIV